MNMHASWSHEAGRHELAACTFEFDDIQFYPGLLVAGKASIEIDTAGDWYIWDVEVAGAPPRSAIAKMLDSRMATFLEVLYAEVQGLLESNRRSAIEHQCMEAAIVL
jgi:hypothetical protein